MEKEIQNKLAKLEAKLKTCKPKEQALIEFALAEIYDLYNRLIINGHIQTMAKGTRPDTDI